MPLALWSCEDWAVAQVTKCPVFERLDDNQQHDLRAIASLMRGWSESTMGKETDDATLWLLSRYGVKIRLAARNLRSKMDFEDAESEIRLRFIKVLFNYKWHRKATLRAIIDSIAYRLNIDQHRKRHGIAVVGYEDADDAGMEAVETHAAFGAVEAGFLGVEIREALGEASPDAVELASLIASEVGTDGAKPQPWQLARVLEWEKPRVEAAMNELRGLLAAFR